MNEARLSAVLAALDAAGRPPLVVVVGAAGAGHTTLLERLGAALLALGGEVVPLCLTSGPMTTSLHLGLGVQVDALATPRQAATAIRQSLVDRGNVTILIDDAQWLDPFSLAVLEQLARLAAGTGVRCVCVVHLPVPRAVRAVGQAALDRLGQDGLVRQLTLRPLNSAEITEITAATFEARPDPLLVAQLRRLSAGLPAALVPLLERYRDTETVRVVDDCALLAQPRPRPSLPEDHPLLLHVRRAGPLAWSAAKALAVLCPLGAAAPELLGQALDCDEPTARRLVADLVDVGVLRRAGTGWRFPVPLLATALAGCLGPYERRSLARRAITALWQRQASCADPGYLADQLAIAGSFVDRERARTELLASAAGSDGADERWLRAAAELSGSPADRARTLLRHVTVSLRQGGYRQALASVATIDGELADTLTISELQELDRMRVLAGHANGDTDALAAAAADPHPARVTGRATALLLTGRWHECDQLLAKHRTSQPDAASWLPRFIEAQAHLFSGRPAAARDCLRESARTLPANAEAHRGDLAAFDVLATVLTRGAAAVPTPAASAPILPTPALAVLAAGQGRFDLAMDLARRAVATRVAAGHDATHTVLYHAAATIQLSRGRLSQGLELLSTARAFAPPLPYLLDGAEAMIEVALGRSDQARDRLRAALSAAARAGLVIETDRLWAQLAQLELARGEPTAARRCVTELDRVAEQLASPWAALRLALTGALVERDEVAAKQAVQLAGEVGQPFDTAEVTTTLVAHDLADPGLLTAAYRTLGELDALLHRAWLRKLMQERGVPIPGRRQTVEENERLLSVTVADGLGNKEIAAVLRTSEKSVEGRLGRLFARTGYRSRVELAMAVATGAYAGRD